MMVVLASIIIHNHDKPEIEALSVNLALCNFFLDIVAGQDSFFGVRLFLLFRESSHDQKNTTCLN